jgi:HAD superfamily hydrolase (TIGR01490 family)
MEEKQPADFYDIDGTWYRWQLIHSWVEQAVQMKVLPDVDLSFLEVLLAEYKEHRGSFEAFAQAVVEAYIPAMQGVRIQDAVSVAKRTVARLGGRTFRFTAGLAEASRQACRHRIIISGSLDVAVQAFAEHHGIETWYGTEFHTESGLYTDRQRKVWYHNKAEAVLDAASRLKIDLTQSVAIGDSMADISMFDLVGFPVCFNPDVQLYKIARERGWPVVRERKNLITITKPGVRRRFQEISLRDALPAVLFDGMERQTELMKHIDPW